MNIQTAKKLEAALTVCANFPSELRACDVNRLCDLAHEQGISEFKTLTWLLNIGEIQERTRARAETRLETLAVNG